ncbi:MAG: EscU/YscU/HrcU family type III secretion system export apparatus switch protein [Bryobacteraceae bacterium]|nr:EscU/YscU/HrcU family type III secretion system export apparatus switch protein [Bryobacteraceae bacterium]MDW8380047.1 EscU/YscU/HrcU family type III secretion system export apparatus switch protein [Bryobacterales bacterium]
MADQGQRTEQPTPRRLEKARREGRFPVSKEFLSATTFAAFVWLVTTQADTTTATLTKVFRDLLRASFQAELWLSSPHSLGLKVVPQLLPAVAWGLGLTLLALGTQLVSTGFGFAPAKLTLDFSRLLPTGRLSQTVRQNLASAGHALVLLPLFAWAAYSILSENLSLYERLARFRLEAAIRGAAASLGDLLRKAAFLLLIFGAWDLLRQRRKWKNEMRMSKQEVKDEQKEAEGSPLMRMRIRRLQRDLARRRMMQQVPKATAVIVNPTHYAVAIRYQMGESAAPRIVAKGKNWLAQRIRLLAAKHQVPIVENAPLARALYGAAEVGQEIPTHLYQAVAEVLAYIYRLMRAKGPGRREGF